MNTGKNSTPLHTALTYAIFGALWILFSDVVVNFLVPLPSHILIQSIKGPLFVLISAGLIHFISSTDMKSLLESVKRYQSGWWNRSNRPPRPFSAASLNGNVVKYVGGIL